MRQAINNLSLKVKLILIIVLVSGVSSLTSNIVFLFNEHAKSKKTAISEMISVVRVVANNTVVALEFSDATAAKENLVALAHTDSVLKAEIFDFNYELMASISPNESGNELNPQLLQQLKKNQQSIESKRQSMAETTESRSEAYSIDGDHVQILKGIYLEGKLLGYLQLESKLFSLSDKAISAIRFGFLMVLLELVVAFILASGLHRVITGPIKGILSTVEEVTSSSNYKLRIEKNRSDELGELIDGFNDMLTQIEHRDEVLADTNLILEQEVKQQTADLVHARDKALDANRAKTTFLANMSHEIRTPLNAILGFSQVLSSENLDTSHKDMVRRIEIAGESLLAVINDILDLSKIEAGQVNINKSKFNLTCMIEDLTSLFSIACLRKGISWHVDAQIPANSWVEFDKAKLNQILINLIGNAVKFTKVGGITLCVSETKEDELKENSTTEMALTFEVIDTGRGIDNADIQRIIEPFEQAETDGFIEGTGLGLGIVQKLLSLFGSELVITSELGTGSDFQFDIVLPLSVDRKGSEITTNIDNSKLSQLPLENNLRAPNDDVVKANKVLVSNRDEEIGLGAFEGSNIEEGILLSLLKYLELGQISNTEKLLSEIPVTDSVTRVFIKKCKVMLENYDLEALLEQIELLVSSKNKGEK